MSTNANLRKADKTEFDEYYTQYEDIQREINAYLEYDKDVFKNKTVLLPCDDPEWSNFTKFFAQNFEMLGLKKLISTSYAMDSKNKYYNTNIFDNVTDFEKKSPKYNKKKSKMNGKIFVLEKDITGNGKIDIEDLEWSYLEGDGDFRSEEVTKLRDEADFIITNPPFSLFREFVSWIMEGKKKFVIIGNQNAITYKEIFPLIKHNKLWLGNGFYKGNAYFKIPLQSKKEYANGVYNEESKLVKFRNCCWFTNLDHGRRHQPLQLMTMNDNLKFGKHKRIKEEGYEKYDNYNAIEVAFTDAIPSDYDGAMGVPITFLNKYCPEQFEILDGIGRYSVMENERTKQEGKYLSMVNGKAKFFRIIIRKKV